MLSSGRFPEPKESGLKTILYVFMYFGVVVVRELKTKPKATKYTDLVQIITK